MSEQTIAEIADPRRRLIVECVQYAFDMIGEGFIIPEDIFCTYTGATEDQDWETLHLRIVDDFLAHLLSEGHDHDRE